MKLESDLRLEIADLGVELNSTRRELAEANDRANNLRLAYDAQTRKLAEARGALYTRTKEFETMCAGYKRDQAEIKALRTAAARVVKEMREEKYGDWGGCEGIIEEWADELAAVVDRARADELAGVSAEECGMCGAVNAHGPGECPLDPSAGKGSPMHRPWWDPVSRAPGREG